MANTQRRHERGSAMTLAIVVSVVLSGLILAMMWTAGAQAATTGGFSKMDQAFFAAEAGAERVHWYVKNNKMNTITSPLAGTCNGYSYTVSWTSNAQGYLVSSTGLSGSVSYALSVVFVPPTPPVLASGGDFENKNLKITGDITTGGNYTNGGSGQLKGNLVYFGSATNTQDVTGTITKGSGSFTPIDMTAVGANLVSNSGLTYNSNQTGTVFNFTTVGGANPVIVVNGSVTNPTFIGSGTLYATGNVSVGGFGTKLLPVNIVAQGGITVSNNVTIYGSIYAKGNFTRDKFDMTGMLYTQGTVSQGSNGSSKLTMTTAPWFDPRTNGTASNFLNFTGPQP